MSKKFARTFAVSLIFAIALAFVAGYKVIGESRDYENYESYFTYLIENPDAFDFSYRFEPGFSLLAYLFSLVTADSSLIYFLIVWAFVFIKYLSIPIGRKHWLVLLVFSFYFLSRYFVLFEMTVLRAACAFSLAFLVFIRRDEDEIKVSSVLILILAIAFHYSAVIFLPIYFLRNLTRRRVLVAAAVGFFIVLLIKPFLFSMLSEYFSLIETYESAGEASLLPVPYLLDLCYLATMFWFWRKNDIVMKSCALGISIGAALHFSLLEYSVLASRFRELLSVFILIYVVKASISKSDAVRYLSWIYVLVSGCLHLYVEFIYDPLLS